MTNGELNPVLIARINESLNTSGGVAYTWVYQENENSGSVWPSEFIIVSYLCTI